MITHIVNIVICYANEDEVIEYAKQLAKQTFSERIMLCIVINKSNKGIEYLDNGLKKIHLEYKLINSKVNLGYLNGLVYGYKFCEMKDSWFVLSNTDIKIPDEKFFYNFSKKEYISNGDIWVVGPSVYAPNKKIFSNPYLKNRPSKRSYVIKNIGMNFPNIYEVFYQIKSTIKKKKCLKKVQHFEMIYAVHGSFMFVRSELLELLCSFAPWELLYDEEQYIGEVVDKYKKIEIYDPALQVLHLEGASTGKVKLKNRYKRMINSNKRIIKEFY